MNNVGDLVWAKVRYCPHWPAIVVGAPTDFKMPKNHIFVRFFGSNNFGIIDPKNIHGFHEYRSKYERKKKTNDMKNALQCIDEYSANPSAFADHDDNTTVEGEITLIQELGDTIKVERDMDSEPFDTIQVNVTNNDPRDQEISVLKAEKANLVIDLLNLKSQNNDMFLRDQGVQRKQNLLVNENRTLREQNQLYKKETNELRQVISSLKSSNDTLKSLVVELQTHIRNYNGQASVPLLIDQTKESPMSPTNTSQMDPNFEEEMANQTGETPKPLVEKSAIQFTNDLQATLPPSSNKLNESSIKNGVKMDLNAEKGMENQKRKPTPAGAKSKNKRKSNDNAPKEPEEKKSKISVEANVELIDEKKIDKKDKPAVKEPKRKSRAKAETSNGPEAKYEKKVLKGNVVMNKLGALTLEINKTQPVQKSEAKRLTENERPKMPSSNLNESTDRKEMKVDSNAHQYMKENELEVQPAVEKPKLKPQTRGKKPKEPKQKDLKASSNITDLGVPTLEIKNDQLVQKSNAKVPKSKKGTKTNAGPTVKEDMKAQKIGVKDDPKVETRGKRTMKLEKLTSRVALESKQK